MGKITEALKKISDERITRIQKKPRVQYVVKRAENTKIDEHIVSFHDPTSVVGEQYKILRTHIQSLKGNKNCKVFLVTSSLNGEGKTVTAINLAISMANDLNNKSVLLIDADMRKGRIAKYLGLDQHAGLSDMLKDGYEANSTFINPNINNLTIITAGKVARTPSELLGSKKMVNLIASLKTEFDYIFIDSPPVLPLTDACILGPLVDAVILIVQAGKTQRNAIEHAENRLHQAGAKTLGVVMTNIEYHLPQYLYRYVYEYSEYK